MTQVLVLLQQETPTNLIGNRPQCFARQNEATRRPYTVMVEGNVGVGKSTFVNILAGQDGRIAPVPEPVEVWQNFSGTNLLDLMYKDGKRWSGPFQLVSTYSRYNLLDLKCSIFSHIFFRLKVATESAKDPRPVRIMERSIFSERYCFLEMIYKHGLGLLSKPEYSLMDQWFRFASHQFQHLVRPDIIGKINWPFGHYLKVN